MADAQKAITTEIQKLFDDWFGKLQKEAGVKIGSFVAFFFFMIAIGAFVGIMVMQRYPNQALMAILLPALAGAVAYYNRTFAMIIFGFLVLIIFFI